MPAVSVLLLGWNHENFIEQSILSVCKQSFRDIELIYVDNCSTDGTYEKAQALLSACGFPFQCFRNSQPKGVSANLNFLLSKASGKYTLLLSTDDWLHENCIEEKVKYYEAHPDIGMLYSGGWTYFEKERKVELVDSSNFRRGHITKELFLEDNVVFFIGCMYKKSVLDELGGWDENLLIEDLDMFIRISTKYRIDYVDQPLVYYRKMSASASGNIEFMVKGWVQYYEKYKHLDSINMKKWMAEKFRAYAAVSIDRKEKQKAWFFLRKAFRYNLFSRSNVSTLLYLVRS